MSLEKSPMNRNLILGEEVNASIVKSLIRNIADINYDDTIKQREFVNFKREPIKLYINTNGGSVRDGFGIIGVIENSTTPVYTICTGNALSMGLPILLSGHRRFAYKYSTILYHEITTIAWSTIKGITQDLDEAKREQKIIDDMILNKTNILKEQLEKIKEAKKDWYISAQEALKMNIIDEIL